MPTSDVELLVLADTVSAAMKEVKQAQNRLRSSQDDLETAKQAILAKRGLLLQAEEALRASQRDLDIGLKDRIP